jgi:lysine N6-hydroxylase
VHYSSRIDTISFDDGFSVYSDDRLLARSDHLVLGLGSRSKMPAAFVGLDDRVVLADHLYRHKERLAADPSARIAVVGGGQTGAECVLEMLRLGHRDIWWFGRRPWFQTLEDSPSANDLYRPSYTTFLPQLPDEARRGMVAKQVLTSDGVSDSTLREIYQHNYDAMLECGRNPVTLLPGRDVVAAHHHRQGLSLTCDEAGGRESYEVWNAVVAAGREPTPLPVDDELRDMIEFDDHGEPIVEPDYSLRWNGPAGHKIFAQNRAPSVHGLADKNLSLLAPRAATIINSLFERKVFAVRDECVTTLWGKRAMAAPMPLVPDVALEAVGVGA